MPQSELAQERVLSLPMYPELSESQIEYVAETIEKFVTGA
jgi:dTDP-4-amino-4,6-dideoxygalactose transaminase